MTLRTTKTICAIMISLAPTTTHATIDLKINTSDSGRITSTEGLLSHVDCISAEEASCKLESAEKALDTLWGIHGVDKAHKTDTVITKMVQATEDFTVTKFAQTKNNITIHGGGVTIVTNRDGDSILSFGQLLPVDKNEEVEIDLGIQRIVENHENLSERSVNGIRTLYSDELDTTLEQRYNPVTRESIWIKISPEEESMPIRMHPVLVHRL